MSSYKMTKCMACQKFISAAACNFGCPHCGYTDGWDATIPPLEDIKGVGNDKKRLRTDGSSNEKPQRITPKSHKGNYDLTVGALKKRQSKVWRREVHRSLWLH